MRLYPTKEQARTYGARQNPLLMVVNPKGSSAPRSRIKAPFTEGKRIPVAKFEDWLYANASPNEIRDYERVKKDYRQFHLGVEPRTVTRELMNVSSSQAITDRAFTYSMGRSTHETYNAPKHSKKSGVVYVHRYTDQPEALVFPGGRLIMKKLKGRAKITDWMRG